MEQQIGNIRYALGFVVEPNPTGTLEDPYPGSAIQDAIDNLPPMGGQVIISSGYWEMKSGAGNLGPLQIPDNVFLSGSGSNTILFTNDENLNICITNMNISNGNTNITLSDFKLDGSKVGIRFMRASECNIKNIIVENSDIVGISNYLCEKNTIQNCILENVGFGDGNTKAINISECIDCFVINCKINNCDKQGIYVSGENNNVSNCYIDNISTYQAIALGNLENSVIYNNTIIKPKTNGISCEAGAYIKHCRIINNHVNLDDVNNEGDGIFIDTDVSGTTKHNIISDNVILHTNGSGVVLMSNVQKTIVRGNSIYNARNSGIAIDDNSEDNVIIGNTIHNSGLNGITVSNTENNIISNNIIKKCGQRGVISNTYGINIWNSSKNIISGNSCYDDLEGYTQTQGIRKGGDGSKNVVMGNNSDSIVGFGDDDVVCYNINRRRN